MCKPYRQAQSEWGIQMRIGWIALAAMVAIGLIWSAATTSKLVPLPSAELSRASIVPDGGR
jgi:hypothetical protein